MFNELVAEPGSLDPEELHGRYLAALADVVEREGVEEAAAASGVEGETLRGLVAGESPELDLGDAAAVLALDHDADGETIAEIDRDALLMGMTNAVLDVESLASELDGSLEPREIQAKVEGRYPMTLREFAQLHATIQRHAP